MSTERIVNLIVIIRHEKAYVQQLVFGLYGVPGEEQFYTTGLEPAALAWALEQAYSSEPEVQRK